MYPITQGSVFKRTQQVASRLHNLSKVQSPFVAASRFAGFFFLSAIFPRTCRAQEGVKRIRFTVNS